MSRVQLSAMSMLEAERCSHVLADRIEAIGVDPRAVIAIGNGGLLPASVVAGRFQVPIVRIRVARPMSRAKEHLPLEHVPDVVKTVLRRLEMSLGVYRVLKRRDITGVTGTIASGVHIVVDDSLDTGNTMVAVLRYLDEIARIPRRDVLVTVLTQMFDDPVVPADVALFRGINYRFPWSHDSNEYEAFTRFCELNIPAPGSASVTGGAFGSR